MQTDTIYEYSPYADQYTLFGCFDQLLQECEDHGLQMDRDPGWRRRCRCNAREWVLYNREISSVPVETITDPDYLITCQRSKPQGLAVPV